MSKRGKTFIPDVVRGTKCSFCGEVFTYPKGYSYPQKDELSYDIKDHPVTINCISYLAKELKEANNRIEELEYQVKSLDRDVSRIDNKIY